MHSEQISESALQWYYFDLNCKALSNSKPLLFPLPKCILAEITTTVGNKIEYYCLRPLKWISWSFPYFI